MSSGAPKTDGSAVANTSTSDGLSATPVMASKARTTELSSIASMMTSASLSQREPLSLSTFSGFYAGLSRAQAEEYLRSLMRICEVGIQMEFKQNETLEISLTPNLIVRAIRTQRALSELIVGDQLLLVNGKAPVNVDQAHKLLVRCLPTLHLVVSRVAYKESVPAARVDKIQLKRQQGCSYFLATIKRVGPVHLRLGLKAHKGKIVVNRIEENTLAAYIYLVGDSILDINGERITDVNRLRAKMIESMRREGTFTTVVERSEPTHWAHNVRELAQMSPEVEPQMANDVNLVCQREIVRHRLCSKKRRELRTVWRSPKLATTATHAEATVPHDDDTSQERKRSILSISNSKKRIKRSHDKQDHLSGRWDVADSSSSRRRRRKKQHVSVNMHRNEEEEISTDVVDPLSLQHVPNLNKQGLNKTLTTFMPFFRN